MTKLADHAKVDRTVRLLPSGAGVMGFFAVANSIKESSLQAVAELGKLGFTTIMLYGDSQETANAISHIAGIEEFCGNFQPEDKLAAIKAIQTQYSPTVTTGDCINDAPAPAQADIVIAMGVAGNDISIEAAYLATRPS